MKRFRRGPSHTISSADRSENSYYCQDVGTTFSHMRPRALEIANCNEEFQAYVLAHAYARQKGLYLDHLRNRMVIGAWKKGATLFSPVMRYYYANMIHNNRGTDTMHVSTSIRFNDSVNCFFS